MRGTVRSAVEQVVRQPFGIARAFLAEAYDGIGQFVLVSLSRSSSSAALRARIAAGDFGGGRTFPVGTPVSVVSIRGQLTVLSLGNIPRKPVAGCICGITDDFQRSVSGGWGAASCGLLWANGGSSSSSVSSGIGTLNGPDSQVLTFSQMAVGDTCSINAQQTGGSDYHLATVALLWDMYPGSGDSGGATVSFPPSGGLAYVYKQDGTFVGTIACDIHAGVDITFTVQSTGILVVIGPGSVTVPSGAQPLVDQVSISTISSNVYQVSVLDATDINICTQSIFDRFDRTTSGDWGTASCGAVWHKQGPGESTQLVSDPFGEINQRDPGYVPNDHGQVYSYTPDAPAAWSGDFSIRVDVDPSILPDTANTGTLAYWGLGMSESNPPSSLDQAVLFTRRDHSLGDIDTLSLITPSGTTKFGTSRAGQGTTTSLRWTKTGTRHQVRVWGYGSPEPSTWDIDTTGSAIAAASFFFYQQQPFTRSFTSDPRATLYVWWSNLDIDYAGKPCPELKRYWDGFDRTVAGGWGISPDGHTWSQYLSDGSASVDGSAGILSSVTYWTHEYIDGTGPWSQPFTMEAQFSIDHWSAEQLVFVAADFQVGIYGTSSPVPPPTSPQMIYIQGWNGSYGADFTLVDGTTYRLKFQAHLGDNTVRLKIWPAGSSEPTDWLISADDGAYTEWSPYFEISHGKAATLRVDYIDFKS